MGLLWMQASQLQAAGDIEGAIAIYEAMYARDSGNAVIANNLASLITTFRDTPADLDRAWAVARRLRGATEPAFADTYGWILVTGSEVPDPADDVDACFVWLRGLSEKLGEIQYFAADRALGHHAWARLLSGEVFRAYAWVDETVWTQGELTRAELDLGMHCPGYGESATADEARPDEACLTNAEKVSALAARWSIDPASLDLGRHWPRPGVAGQFSPH
jgi:hypothetical protein